MSDVAMRTTLSAFAPLRRHATNNASLQKLPAPRFLSPSHPLRAYQSHDGAENMTAEQRRIHILGIGNIGTFVGHALKSIPQPPDVTLMLHRPEQYQVWREIGRRLILERNELSEHKTGYDVNWLEDGRWYTSVQRPRGYSKTPGEDKGVWVPTVDEGPIDHLILTVKAINVVLALRSVRHRLTPQSTIVFIHNGMGVIEEVNRDVFPDPATRPSYVVGIVSHGLYRNKYFNVVHRGIGTTTLGVVSTNPQAALPGTETPTTETGSNTYDINPEPTTSNNNKDAADTASPTTLSPTQLQPTLPKTTSYLLRTLARTPLLTPFLTNPTDLHLLQLEKLITNALINPLTVLNDCTNGHLLKNENITRTQRLLLFELSAVISSLPELRGVPGLKKRFAPERLLRIAQNVAAKTAANASSMLQDVAAGRPTEIEYINGYVVRRGEEVGVSCALNYMLVQLVKGKAKVMRWGLGGQVPFEEEKGSGRERL